MSNYLTIRDVADSLGVSTFTIRRAIDKEQLKAFRVGTHIRISPDSFQEFLAARQMRAKPKAPKNPPPIHQESTHTSLQS